jgi:hypothetical protein
MLLEILAVANALQGGSRDRSLYVAPTRALAQAKFAELRERYGHFRAFDRRPIILATGEDNEDDWRFRTGAFGIAICVYEKANVIAQVQRSLIDQLGLVLIDEAHMLSDLDRGPILEMFLLKVLSHRGEQEERGENRERKKVRVVVVSTEAVETGPNGHPIIQLMTETRALTNERREPFVVSQPHRPGIVKHQLVMPAQVVGQYHCVLIKDFENSPTRSLSPEERAVVEYKISTIEREYELPNKDFASLKRLFHESKSEPAARLQSLLVDLSRSKNTPRRTLIFMPSVASIVSFANRFRRLRRETQPIDPAFEDGINGLDDDTEKEHFRQLANVGIFIHHSGVDRALRDSLANLWARPLETGGHEFLFATETLSFGVNLAIDDVVMYGTSIYSNARNRNKEGAALPYTACEFHNMIGRAGRLDRGLPNAGPSNVYILPVGDVPGREVIRKYYVGTPSLESRLFVEDDVVREGRGEAGKRLGNISHAFVHAMLDLLRFVSRDEDGAATIDALMDRLEQRSLFSFQLRHKPHSEDVRRALRASLETVMEGCASEEDAFQLIERKGAGRPVSYLITQKGRDVLDTGTEIQTLKPLVNLSREIEEIVWKPAMGTNNIVAMPIELILFAVIAQRECYRPTQRAVPESQIEPSSPLAELNSLGVREDFLQTFKENMPGHVVDAAEVLVDRLAQVLQGFFVRMNVPASELRRDAVLRLGAMMLRWINGRRLRQVREPLELTYPRRDRRQFTINIQSYTDRIAWKLELLMRLLAPKHEIQLGEMIDRVRLGTSADAVMLLRALPTLRRIRATQMPLRSVLLRREAAQPNLSPQESAKLREGLRRVISGHFAELVQVLCARANINPSFCYVKAVEEYGATLFADDLQAYQSHDRAVTFLLPGQLHRAQDTDADLLSTLPPDQQMIPFDELSEPGLLWSGSDRQIEYRKLSLEPYKNGGFMLLDRGGEEQRDSRLLVLGAHSDWTVQSYDGQSLPFADVLAAELHAERLIFGIAPWLPHPEDWPDVVIGQLRMRNAAGRATVFMTAPALCTWLVMLARNLGSPEDLLYAPLQPGETRLETVHTIRERLIDNPELPSAIRRAMAKFKEFGISLPSH